MIILGLHFGHDASISIVKDGKEIVCLLRERTVRIKHAISLDNNLLQLALKRAKINMTDIDYCSITSTQDLEIIHNDLPNFNIIFDSNDSEQEYSSLPHFFKENEILLENTLIKKVIPRYLNNDSKLNPAYKYYLSEFSKEDLKKMGTTGWLDKYIDSTLWNQMNTTETILNLNIQSIIDDETITHGFCFPITVTLGVVKIPGYFVNHHIAHASSSFFRSPFQSAAIHTHDGNNKPKSFNNGGYFYGNNSQIYPLSPCYLNIAHVYEFTGFFLGLGNIGAAGKLMGLAPYGSAVFFDHGYVGNCYDLLARNIGFDPQSWINHCIQKAHQLGYSLDSLEDTTFNLTKVKADIAASTQKLLEFTFLNSVKTFKSLLRNNNIITDNLCMSGGASLNCPSNTAVFKSREFGNIFIEPNCDDGGLSTGSALYLYFHILENKRCGYQELNPYQGQGFDSLTVVNELSKYENRLIYTIPQNTALHVAKDLIDNLLVGWFEGRSEIGPRALGHRSILANPTIKGNWARLNELKNREGWRPFAPCVLFEFVRDWFDLEIPESPFMLFTAQVKSNLLPAVTHVDGSARIQTVKINSCSLYNILQEFHELSGVPVLLNTSFNGKGEPIIETPNEAIFFLLNSSLDVLYIDGYRIERRRD